jgi:hypothetical protein
MNSPSSATRAVVALLLGTLLIGGGLVPPARAATPDPADVVLVLDFSASILRDKANRDKFAAALDKIAARVDETSSDLVTSDATMSIVQFASKAADVPGCVDLHLLNSLDKVARFADCLRSVAAAYRKGPDPALRAKIGVDTNYVAAMNQAAKHLPADAVRPAIILFSDGKHDVAGVPVSQVQPTRDRLFGNRSPFALLPVGMGIDPKDRAALEAGLTRLRITKDMPACVSGATFDWPTVGFDSPDEAGNAVAVALQEATCTFTVAPTPAPTPAPTLGAVRSIGLKAGDGRIEVTWTLPTTTPEPIVDYNVRCRAGDDGDWIESAEGVSLERRTVLVGLTNGTEYQCEVQAVGETLQSEWTPAAVTVIPFGRPAEPPKPAVAALDKAVQVSVPSANPAIVSEVRYECSPDGGNTWTVRAGPKLATNPTATVGGLTNGVNYVCRAYASNDVGESEASPVSDAVKPCGGLLECNGLLVPIIGIMGVVLTIGLLAMVVALLRERRRGYVLAVLDVVHTANLGHGSRLGIGLVRAPGSRVVSGIVASSGRDADIKIRQLSGDRFQVTDSVGKHMVPSGQPVIVVSGGIRHELVLHAFATNPASRVSTAR